MITLKLTAAAEAAVVVLAVTLNEVQQAAGAIAAVVAAIGALGYAFKRYVVPVLRGIRGFINRAQDVHTDLLGDEGTPSLREELQRVCARLTEGEERFDRLEENVGAITDNVESIEAVLGVLGDEERLAVRAVIDQARRGEAA